MTAITAPLPQFFERNGAPLQNGFIYIGSASSNPETAPVSVYWDAGLTQPASQPIRTIGGFPVRGGNPSNLFVNGDYSLTVRDAARSLVLTRPQSVGVDLALFKASGAGAVTQSVTARLEKIVYADDYGTLVQALAAASAAGGGGVWLTPGKRYTLTTRLTIPSRCGLISDGSAEIYAPAANFSNTSLTGKYLANSCVLDLSGLTSSPFTPADSPFVVGVRIRSEVAGGRMVDAIVARNVDNLVIHGCDIAGFPLGACIRAASLIGGAITNNHIHECTDNTNWGGSPAAPPQITGIELDNDLVNSATSVATRITGNTIRSLTVGAIFLPLYGYQTDGINIANKNSYGIAVCNNTISDVGEGIDHFGKSCALTGNTVSNAYIFGIKMVHGASNNAISGGSIINFGLAGISVSGSSVAGAGDTDGNSITGVTISTGNYNAAWNASSTACILITDNVGTTGKPKNTLVTGCTLTEGAFCKYGWLDSSTGSGNFGEGLVIKAGAANVKRIEVTGAAGTCRIAGSGTYSTSLT
jgi:hypothetical protein